MTAIILPWKWLIDNPECGPSLPGIQAYDSSLLLLTDAYMEVRGPAACLGSDDRWGHLDMITGQRSGEAARQAQSVATYDNLVLPACVTCKGVAWE